MEKFNKILWTEFALVGTADTARCSVKMDALLRHRLHSASSLNVSARNCLQSYPLRHRTCSNPPANGYMRYIHHLAFQYDAAITIRHYIVMASKPTELIVLAVSYYVSCTMIIWYIYVTTATGLPLDLVTVMNVRQVTETLKAHKKTNYTHRSNVMHDASH